MVTLCKSAATEGTEGTGEGGGNGGVGLGINLEDTESALEKAALGTILLLATVEVCKKLRH